MTLGEQMFAVGHEGMIPGVAVIAKELSRGYIPLAITLISEETFSVFIAGIELAEWIIRVCGGGGVITKNDAKEITA